MTASPETLYDVIDATWPAAEKWTDGPWTFRKGLSAGSRVSATTGSGTLADLPAAEAQMSAMDQPKLFMIRHGDTELDEMLAAQGYTIKDPVTLMNAPIDRIATERPPAVTTFEVWPPLAIEREIWLEDGVGPARVAVMERSTCTRTTILGRLDDTPAGTGYVGIHKGVAMFHGLVTLPRFRRRGLAQHMIRAMAFWAGENGAEEIALLVVKANGPANALYQRMGFEHVADYHYRIKAE